MNKFRKRQKKSNMVLFYSFLCKSVPVFLIITVFCSIFGNSFSFKETKPVKQEIENCISNETYVVDEMGETLCAEMSVAPQIFLQSSTLSNLNNSFSSFLENLRYMFFPKTRYVAKAEFYVKNILGTSDYITDGMLTAGAKIASSCVEVAETDLFARAAVDKHQLDQYFGITPEEATKIVRGMISASKTNVDSQAFSITVTSYVSKMDAYVVMVAVQDAIHDVSEMITAESPDASDCEISFLSYVETTQDVETVKPFTSNTIIACTAVGIILLFFLG